MARVFFAFTTMAMPSWATGGSMESTPAWARGKIVLDPSSAMRAG
jgi:hypothetical protein